MRRHPGPGKPGPHHALTHRMQITAGKWQPADRRARHLDLRARAGLDAGRATGVSCSHALDLNLLSERSGSSAWDGREPSRQLSSGGTHAHHRSGGSFPHLRLRGAPLLPRRPGCRVARRGRRGDPRRLRRHLPPAGHRRDQRPLPAHGVPADPGKRAGRPAGRLQQAPGASAQRGRPRRLSGELPRIRGLDRRRVLHRLRPAHLACEYRRPGPAGLERGLPALPRNRGRRERTLRSVHDGFEQAFRGFDRDRYPVWRDWLAGAATHRRRGPVIERMRRAGVLDLPGALEGW